MIAGLLRPASLAQPVLVLAAGTRFLKGRIRDVAGVGCFGYLSVAGRVCPLVLASPHRTGRSVRLQDPDLVDMDVIVRLRASG